VKFPESLHGVTCSPAGREWFERLPGLVAAACDHFAVTPGTPYEGGVAAWVAPVSDEAVLKVRFVDESTAAEPEALRFLGGDGAVRLLDEAPDLGAMLIERCHPGQTLLEHPDLWEAVEIACGLLRRLWRRIPGDHAFETAAVRSRAWSAEIGACQGIPGSWRGIAAERAEALANDGGPLVLGNQDFHLGNVIAAQRVPWLLIDPQPIVAAPAFDTGHFVRDIVWLGAVERDRVADVIARVAALLDLDPGLVSDWALIRTAVDVVWSVGDGDDPDTEDLALGEVLRSLRG
jgi:streptomycin 6-kinase